MPISEIKEIELSSHDEVYEQLFINYLNQHCKRNDCSNIFHRILAGCKLRQWHQGRCTNGAENALEAFCNLNGGSKSGMCKPYLTSTTTSTEPTTENVENKTTSYKLFIYGGIAAAVVYLCFCFIVILVTIKDRDDKKTAALEAKQQADLEAQMKKKKKKKKKGGRTSGTSRHGSTTGGHKKRRKHKKRKRTRSSGTTRKSTKTGSSY